jgi:hypothetical protein
VTSLARLRHHLALFETAISFSVLRSSDFDACAQREKEALITGLVFRRSLLFPTVHGTVWP